jgi:hypothetical protein
MDRFHEILASQHSTPQLEGSEDLRYHLRFAGLILAPDFACPTGPIEALTTEIWSDELNTKLLRAIGTAHAFLPTVTEFMAHVVVLIPNIVPPLRPAFHSVQSTLAGGLDAFAQTLDRELRTLDIPVTRIKLGTFDLSSFTPRSHVHNNFGQSSSNYERNYRSQGAGLLGLSTGSTRRGTNLRELHHAVFDALTMKKPNRVRRVGKGSVMYDIVGACMPSSLVDWMLGIEQVPVQREYQPMLTDASHSWEKVERTAE